MTTLSAEPEQQLSLFKNPLHGDEAVAPRPAGWRWAEAEGGRSWRHLAPRFGLNIECGKERFELSSLRFGPLPARVLVQWDTALPGTVGVEAAGITVTGDDAETICNMVRSIRVGLPALAIDWADLVVEATLSDDAGHTLSAVTTYPLAAD